MNSADHIKEQLEKQRYALVCDVDMSEPRQALIDLMSKIGIPVSYFEQPMAMDVKPQAGYQPVSSGGQAYFSAHTDLTFHDTPPKYIGMLSLSQDDEGGDSILVDGRDIVSELSAEHRRLLEEIDVLFPTPQHISGPPSRQKVLTSNNSDMHIRFRSDLALGQQQDQSVIPALNAFRILAEQKQNVMKIQPGNALIFDNHTMLHGRTEITAQPSVRHLLRTYAN